MKNMAKDNYDVIIIGGSYAGLSAAMALGRSLRNVLIIDSGEPCNKPTPYSHNFLTHDGETPAAISATAKEQVLKYDTVKFLQGKVTDVTEVEKGFNVTTEAGEAFFSKKILFATGIVNEMPSTKGYIDCWGKSILHCPYCHGYEVRNQKTAILADGENAFHMALLLMNWTIDLIVLTDGPTKLTDEQKQKLRDDNIPICEARIISVEHDNGYMKAIHFEHEQPLQISVGYCRLPAKQHSDLPEKLGCTIDEHCFIKVDHMQKTSVPGVYAAGDNTTMMRAVSMAIGGGTMAGAAINMELIMDAVHA